MSTTMLTLDGEPILMKSMRITASMQFQDKDQSGQTSSTGTSEQGSKAKELDVTGIIPFREEQHLTRLFELADQKASGDKRKVYRIGSTIAKAIKVREVKFAGRITAAEQDGMLAWQVQFTLRENNSVPEKKEQRAKTPAAKVTATTANTRASQPDSGGQDSQAPGGSQTLTWFERNVLKPMDDSLS